MTRLFILSALFLCAGFIVSCGDGDIEPRDPRGIPEDMDDVKYLRAAIKQLNERQEKSVDKVTIKHILVKVKEARDKSSAEKKVAKIFADIQRASESERDALFSKLVKEKSEDHGKAKNDGVYVMNNDPPSSTNKESREKMVPGFGDTAWRLRVGEVGVLEWDKQKSAHGYHIIMRLK